MLTITKNMYLYLEKILNYNSRLFFFIIIFLTLIPYHAPDGILSSNEEMYLGFAEKIEVGDSYDNSCFGFSENQSRYITDKTIKILIGHFGFENTQRIGRLLTLIMYAIALSYFFHLLNFNVLQIIFCLLFFCLYGQDLYGGEWLFGGFEAKTLAYPILILALVFLLKEKYILSFIIMGIVTHFHFLIGGWFFVIFIIFILSKGSNIKIVFRSTLIYLLIITPLIFIIAKNYYLLIDHEIYANLPSANWIYSVFRHPHHIVPFNSIYIFIEQWSADVLVSFVILIFSMIFYLNSRNSIIKNISLINVIILIQLSMCLLISFFDSSYYFSKLYMFRNSSISLLLSIILLLFLFDYLLGNKKSQAYFIIFVLIFFHTTPKNTFYLYKQFRKPPITSKNLMNYVMQNTSKDDLILIDRKIENKLHFFERITKRPTLVNYKFIPTTEIGILEWYRRLIFKDKIFKNIPTNDEYNFSYLITSNTNDFLDSTYGHPIYNEEFTIYKNLSIHKPN